MYLYIINENNLGNWGSFECSDKHIPKSDEDRGKWLTEGTAFGLPLDEQSGVGKC